MTLGDGEIATLEERLEKFAASMPPGEVKYHACEDWTRQRFAHGRWHREVLTAPRYRYLDTNFVTCLQNFEVFARLSKFSVPLGHIRWLECE